MNTIAIEGISAEEVITSLSTEFGNEVEENYGEYSLEISATRAKAAVSGINFPNGVGLFKFSMELKEEYCLDFCSTDIHPFKFLYLLEGNIRHQFSNEEVTHKIEEGDSVILGANFKSGNKIFLPKQKKVNLIILDIDRKKFVDQLTFPLEEMDNMYHDIFADTNAIRTIYHHSQYSLKMAHLVNELNSFDAKGLESTSYNGAKALELLTYMLMLYKDDSKTEEQQSILRKTDLKKIKNVVRTIDQHIEDVRNISELAAKEGITEAKLREGFQILFNDSVHGYIQQRRLEYAMQLLLKTDKTISEIVYDIGLNSRSHFSKIFKERYGKPPTEIRSDKKVK